MPKILENKEAAYNLLELKKQGQSPLSLKQIAKSCKMSQRSVYNIYNKGQKIIKTDIYKNIDSTESRDNYFTTKLNEIAPRKSFLDTLAPNVKDFVSAHATNNSRFSVPELIKLVSDNFKVNLSYNNVYDILHSYDLTHKKVVGKNKYSELKASPADILARRQLIQKCKDIVFIDEVHVNMYDTNDYGWSKKGKPVVFGDKKVYINPKKISPTVISAVTRNTKIYHEVHFGSVNADVYITFLENLIKQTNIKTFYHDNAGIHTATKVVDFLKNQSINVIYGIQYFPDLNIIERAFRSFKTIIRKTPISDRKDVQDFLTQSWNKVDNSVLINTYNHEYSPEKCKILTASPLPKI